MVAHVSPKVASCHRMLSLFCTKSAKTEWLHLGGPQYVSAQCDEFQVQVFRIVVLNADVQCACVQVCSVYVCSVQVYSLQVFSVHCAGVQCLGVQCAICKCANSKCVAGNQTRDKLTTTYNNKQVCPGTALPQPLTSQVILATLPAWHRTSHCPRVGKLNYLPLSPM